MARLAPRTAPRQTGTAETCPISTGSSRVARRCLPSVLTLRYGRRVDWQTRADFARNLDLTRATIADRVANTRPDLATPCGD
jgi:hypothetical protein